MTPSEVEQAAREAYNSIGDSFFSQSSIMTLIYKAQLQLSTRAVGIIERTYTTTSVADQREYDFPTNTVAIKRVEYNSVKLDPIDFRDDDLVNTSTSTTTSTGTPKWYSIWNFALYLRPVPSTSSVTIKIYSYNQPDATTTSSTLEVPVQFHYGLVDYVVSEMAAKDQNWKAADFYRGQWSNTIQEAIQWVASRKRTDGMATVKREEQLLTTILGSR